MTSSNSGNGNVNTPTPHPAPTFPDLNLKPRPAKFTHSHRPHSKVVEIPRRTQQTQAEMEQEEQLQRIYDNRTWTMYHRITEARAAARRTPHIGNPTSPAPLAQQQPPPPQQQHAPLHPTFGHVHPETLLLSSLHDGVENLANLPPPSEDDEHPLIFGDLEE